MTRFLASKMVLIMAAVPIGTATAALNDAIMTPSPPVNGLRLPRLDCVAPLLPDCVYAWRPGLHLVPEPFEGGWWIPLFYPAPNPSDPTDTLGTAGYITAQIMPGHGG